MPDKASESSSSPCPRRGAPEFGGAQMWRRRPRPVPSGPGGPERPPCPGTQACGRAGGHQVPALRAQRLPSPAPGRGATPGPAPVWAPWGGGRALARLPRPQAASYRVPGSGELSSGSRPTYTPLLLGGGSGALSPAPFQWPPSCPAGGRPSGAESGLWASSSVSVGRGR